MIKERYLEFFHFNLNSFTEEFSSISLKNNVYYFLYITTKKSFSPETIYVFPIHFCLENEKYDEKNLIINSLYDKIDLQLTQVELRILYKMLDIKRSYPDPNLNPFQAKELELKWDDLNTRSLQIKRRGIFYIVISTRLIFPSSFPSSYEEENREQGDN